MSTARQECVREGIVLATAFLKASCFASSNSAAVYPVMEHANSSLCDIGGSGGLDGGGLDGGDVQFVSGPLASSPASLVKPTGQVSHVLDLTRSSRAQVWACCDTQSPSSDRHKTQS